MKNGKYEKVIKLVENPIREYKIGGKLVEKALETT
jgi:hypothetical protein